MCLDYSFMPRIQKYEKLELQTKSSEYKHIMNTKTEECTQL